MPSDGKSRVSSFIASLRDVPWFAHAGEPSASYTVAPDAATAWDDWNDRMLAVWLPHSRALEQAAQQQLGDAAIDETFRVVSGAVQPAIRQGMQAYFDRRPEDLNANTSCGADMGLWPEILEFVERDLAWAAIEAMLDSPGFFTNLLVPYREGRWPCSWDGQYPAGRLLVL